MIRYRIKEVNDKQYDGETITYYIIQYKKWGFRFANWFWFNYSTPSLDRISSSNDKTYGMGYINYHHRKYTNKDDVIAYVNELRNLPENILIAYYNYTNISKYYVDKNIKICDDNCKWCYCIGKTMDELIANRYAFSENKNKKMKTINYINF